VVWLEPKPNRAYELPVSQPLDRKIQRLSTLPGIGMRRDPRRGRASGIRMRNEQCSRGDLAVGGKLLYVAFIVPRERSEDETLGLEPRKVLSRG
jgi:hypothetical protein